MGFHFTSQRTLVDFVHDVQRATDRAMHQMAERGGDAMTRHAVENTPRDTGHTAASWFTKPVTIGQHEGTLTFDSGVESHSHIARWLEHGVKPHEMPKGRGVVSFVDPHTGKRVTVRRFYHPGFPGLHLVANAAAFTEANLDSIVRPVLDDWRREAEHGR
jgi:hypothetical protein